jgi:hypothetical protein
MAKETELQDVKVNSAPSLLEGTELNDSTRAKKRPAREKLQQLKLLGGNTRAGYVRRWVKDKMTTSQFGSNIKDKECLGYEVVTNEGINSDKSYGKPTGSVVEKFEFDGTRMVLMEIPKDEYDELQTEKRAMSARALEPLKGNGIYEDAKLSVSMKAGQ